MKKILITGGPTNEYIDEVMKITNMSSGKIAIEMANLFADDGWEVTLLLTKGIKNPNLDEFVKKEHCALIRFETTEELYNLLKEASEIKQDVIIHSAAVADYKPEFSFRLEDMADEIARYVHYHRTDPVEAISNEILHIMQDPHCKVNDDTKISSLEPNLTVKLGLTPKIIRSLREWYPDAYICGFKLLENVPQEELIEAARHQLEKCNTDIVFANDLAELRKGNSARLVVTKQGYHNIKVDGATGIFNLIKIATYDFKS
jgi:phosphopantothenate-cysteine ligase